MSLSTCVPTRVCTRVCTPVCTCACTPVSTPHLLVTRLSPSLFHVTTRPQRQCWAVCSTRAPWRRGGPRVQADGGTGGDQGCRAACGDARLPDSPSGPRRFLHLAGPYVPPPAPVFRGRGCCRASAWGPLGAVCLSVLSSRRQTTQKAPAGRPPTEWGCCPPLGRRYRPHPMGLGGGASPCRSWGMITPSLVSHHSLFKPQACLLIRRGSL